MERQTESESKIAKIFAKVLATPLENEPTMKDSLNNISIAPFIFADDLPKIMLVTMPLDLLIYSKLHSAEILATLKKEFPKYMILMRRTGDIPESKVFTPIKARENIIADMVFPSIVSGRANEVKSIDEMEQIVYLDGKNQSWTKPELVSLGKLMCTVFKQDFKVKIFGAGI